MEKFAFLEINLFHIGRYLAAVVQGQTQVHGFLMRTDNLATVNVFQQMGVSIEVIDDENIVLIDGVGMSG